MRSEKFSYKLYRKSTTWFFTFLNLCIYSIERDEILISQLTPQKDMYFADQDGRKDDPININFDNFQIKT